MIRAALIGAALLGLAGVVQADTCAVFDAGQDQPKGATCTLSRVLGGGVSEDCSWSFPLRADAARQRFDEMSALLRSCADGPVTMQGAAVNHPDSYDQLTAQVGGQEVSLSLKDKGALGRSFVFLRRAASSD
ncbi:hypothetical protein MWU54_17915 [Marivita sp. S6314]|uniref:hypothetical protein n=1 Tax=Marivita sp. S6314 TaxID=2926406 RepID=UPI001FF544FB|nr:hypothetical protein [Marivita sp. S6314]MCK0151925.1 hypothetical protein [Marivita sp. S6314]